MTLLSCSSWASTSPLWYPGTASFEVSTEWPATRAMSAPTSCGYGVQSHAVPYGTESPRAAVAVTSLSFATSSGETVDDAGPEPDVVGVPLPS